MGKISLEDALKKINKGKKGNDVLKPLGENEIVREHVSTGSPFLDWLSGGGWAVGGYNTIQAEHGVGKSTIALNSCVQALLENDTNCVAYFDGEGTLTESYLQRIGLGKGEPMRERFLHVVGRNLEETLDKMELLASVDTMRLIVIDSIHIFVSTVVENKSAEDDYMAIEARKFQQRMSIVEGNSRGRCAILGLNTAREKIHSGNYTVENLPRGKWQLTYSNSWFRLARGDLIKDSDGKPIGHTIRARVMKSKDTYYDGKLNYEFNFYYDGCFDELEQFFELFLMSGIVEQRGPYYYYFDKDGVEVGNQGKAKAVASLKEDEESYNILKERLNSDESPEDFLGNVFEDIEDVIVEGAE